MALGPVDSAVLTGVVVTTGRWSEGKSLDMRVFVGAAVLAIGLAVINAQNQKLGSAFSTLVLVAALFNYGTSIAHKTGLTK